MRVVKHRSANRKVRRGVVEEVVVAVLAEVRVVAQPLAVQVAAQPLAVQVVAQPLAVQVVAQRARGTRATPVVK